MWCKYRPEELINLVNIQLNNNWGNYCEKIPISAENIMRKTLNRLEKNFSKVKSGYFRVNDEVAFKVEHSVQYAIFLYLLSNELYKCNLNEQAAYIYYLNKILHSVEWFYAVDLPDYFCAEHPLGSVLGKAQYGNYFFVYQGVTVGGNRKGQELFYPIIGNHVTMYADSKVIGNSHIGNHVIIAGNAYIKDSIIPDNSIVFGDSPNLVIKRKSKMEILELTRHLWI